MSADSTITYPSTISVPAAAGSLNHPTNSNWQGHVVSTQTSHLNVRTPTSADDEASSIPASKKHRRKVSKKQDDWKSTQIDLFVTTILSRLRTQDLTWNELGKITYHSKKACREAFITILKRSIQKKIPWNAEDDQKLITYFQKNPSDKIDWYLTVLRLFAFKRSPGKVKKRCIELKLIVEKD